MTPSAIECITKCPLECSFVKYPSTLSYSQLSDQAASKLLEKYSQTVSNSYTSSLELSYRINSNIPFLKDILTISSQTNSLLTTLGISLKNLENYCIGLQKFNSLVDNDMSLMRSGLQAYLAEYESRLKVTRHKAIQYLTDAVNRLKDLQFEMYDTLTSFTTVKEFNWYTTGLWSLLSESSLSVRLAITFLSRAFDSNGAEKGIYSLQYASILYPASNNEYNACNVSYNAASKVLSTFIPILSYASQKVLWWLQLDAARSSVPSVRNLSNNNDKNEVNQINNTSFAFTNLRDLFDCLDCPQPIDMSEWIVNFHNLDLIFVDNISNCLLAYEYVLSKATQSAAQAVASAPLLVLSDVLQSAQKSLFEKNQQLGVITQSYRMGSIDGRNCSALADDLLNEMATYVMTINSEVDNVINTWLIALFNWQTSLTNMYLTTLNNALLLSEYLSNTKHLFRNISTFKIWLNLKVVVQPDVKVVPTSRNSTATQSNVLFTLEKSSSYDDKLIRMTFSNIYNSISLQSHDLVDWVTATKSSWLDGRNNFIASYQAFNASFQINDDFIR